MGKFLLVLWIIWVGCVVYFCFRRYVNTETDKSITMIKTTTTCRDTLVEIETIKYIPRTDLNKDYVSSTIIESQPDELFKDGKTCDTITKTSIEYYNP